jgi:hypothetical protein
MVAVRAVAGLDKDVVSMKHFIAETGEGHKEMIKRATALCRRDQI